IGLAILAIILDQWTKWIAVTHLNYADPIPVLPFLNWTLLHNYGAAFSFLSDAGGWQRYFFTSLAALVSIIFVFWLMRMPKHMKVLPLAIALILRSEEHTSELQSRENLVCRLLLEKKKI